MRTVQFVSCIALLCSGCTITIGPLDETAKSNDSKTSVLPGPKDGYLDEPELDDTQQKRKAEAEQYVAQVIYKGATIVEAIQLPSGDVVDGIDRNTLGTIVDSIPPLPWTPEDLTLPSGVELGLTDLDQYPELADLVARTAPFHRPTFWPYILGETDATSIQDYLDRYQVGGAPLADRLYAGLISTEQNRGISGSMNQFRPRVATKSLSILEFAVYCPATGPAEEMVGVVISVDKVNGFGQHGKALEDGEPRLHIEYARPKGGHVEYEWDEMDGQFVANPIRRYRPGQIVPVSEAGGTQVEHLVAIFQSPLGDWWIAYKDDLLGYYPASLFTKLSGGACASAWYGETYDPAPDISAVTGAIKTEMGSGTFAEAGFLHAAYVRNPKYYDLYWYGEPPKDDAAMAPYAPLCYDRSPFSEGIFFLGGPGGNNPSCKWP